MRPIILGVLVASLSSAGCSHLALERNTLRQSATLTDIRYGQVLDNLALVANNPSALPYYSVISGGTAQVDTTANANAAFFWGWAAGQGASNNQTLGIGGQRNVTGNWSLDPLHDPERLEAMRCVYRHALGHNACADPECAELIKFFRLEPSLAKIPQGVFHIGCKRDVPKGACYVGRYCDTYIWVAADGVEALTRLSLTILDIATVDINSLTPTKSIVRKYDQNCKLTAVEVTRDVGLDVPDCSQDPPPTTNLLSPLGTIGPKVRREFPGVQRGLFTLPRR